MSRRSTPYIPRTRRMVGWANAAHSPSRWSCNGAPRVNLRYIRSSMSSGPTNPSSATMLHLVTMAAAASAAPLSSDCVSGGMTTLPMVKNRFRVEIQLWVGIHLNYIDEKKSNGGVSHNWIDISCPWHHNLSKNLPPGPKPPIEKDPIPTKGD